MRTKTIFTGSYFFWASAAALKMRGLSGGRGVDPWTKSILSAAAQQPIPTEDHAAFHVALRDPDVRILVCTGPAGTGKTFMACQYALETMSFGGSGATNKKSRRAAPPAPAFDKLILTRPTVPCSHEELGFLPGDANEKMRPWLQPFVDCLGGSGGSTASADLQKYVADGRIEFAPMAFMRGRSLDHTLVLADEMQNSTPKQMEMLLSRIGRGSKIVVLGDPAQSDLRGTQGGLADFLVRYHMENKVYEPVSKEITVVELTAASVMRDPVVRLVLNLYK